MLSEILETVFKDYYLISSKEVHVDFQVCKVADFDLDDMPSPISIKPFGGGELSFKGNHEELEVIHYEDFINQCKRPVSFSEGRKRCDYLITSMASEGQNGHIILAELTSALGSVENLTKPIDNYEGGKYEKGEVQLKESLKTLMEVPEIKSLFDNMNDRQCILAYKIKPYNDPTKNSFRPMERYLKIETLETKTNGAVIPCPEINERGFTFRRINHETYYQL